jgi:histidine phosphatase superfamily protein (branch 1)
VPHARAGRQSLVYSDAVKRAVSLGLALLLLVAGAQLAAAQEAIFVVRHAERADTSADSPLSADGEARAARLAALLKDAGITQIYTTDRQRTIQTAAPLAAERHLTPAALKSGDTGGLMSRLHAASAHDRILVVGHSNTVPAVLSALGVAPAVTLNDDEYDNLFLVVPTSGAAPRLFRFRF